MMIMLATEDKADDVVPGYPTPKPMDPQKESLRRLFDSIAGKDMEVDWMELKLILDHSMRDAPIVDETHGFSKDVCRSMVAMLDADKSGKLGFEEFEALLSDIAKWKAIFKTYDTENCGRISGFQLREALNSAGYHLNNRVLNALGHRYGSRDGKIAFDDFLMCAVKIKTYIEIFKERDAEKNETATFTLEEWIERTIYS
ncbi:GH20201 [Drosophila grimshawi]|uniref:GH20201 n=1 Tax=Drosophila grimshawi TaxID=7222 RepID=B4J628_DROGR|nr:GH20201 [Drosophila grimshawi]